MKKIFISLVAILLFVACQNTTNSKTNIYTDKNFSFEYPMDWQKSETETIFHSTDKNQMPSFRLSPPLPKDGDFGMGMDNYKTDEYLSKYNVKWTLRYFEEDQNFYKEINETADEKWRMVRVSSPYLSKDVFDGMIYYQFEDGVDVNAEAQLKQILDSFKKF